MYKVYMFIYEGIDCLIYQDGYNDSILVCCDTSYICKYHIGAGVCIHIPVCTYLCVQLSVCTYVCIDLYLYYECIVWLKTTHWVLYAHICIIVILIIMASFISSIIEWLVFPLVVGLYCMQYWVKLGWIQHTLFTMIFQSV